MNTLYTEDWDELRYSREAGRVADERRAEADGADAAVDVGMRHVPLGALDRILVVADGGRIHGEAIDGVVLLPREHVGWGLRDEADGRVTRTAGQARHRRVLGTRFGSRPARTQITGMRLVVSELERSRTRAVVLRISTKRLQRV